MLGRYELILNALGKGYSHARKVKWLGEFSRDDMSTSLRNSMGGISTVFNLDKHRHELLRLTQQQTAGLEPGEHEDENDIVPFY